MEVKVLVVGRRGSCRTWEREKNSREMRRGRGSGVKWDFTAYK